MKKHVALVTGANRGIGKEVCNQLLLEGFEVVLTSRDESKGMEAMKNLQEKHKSDAIHFHQLDVADMQSIENTKKFIEKKFERLDVLINNAGINYDTWQKAIDPDIDESIHTMNINLFGPWRVVKVFAPLLKASDRGRIVNVSSGAGMLNGMRGGTPAYGVSKAALNALTIKLADEFEADKVLVNSVCPGWVRTDMGGSSATRSIEEGASSVMWAVLIDDDGPTGEFFRDGIRLEW